MNLPAPVLADRVGDLAEALGDGVGDEMPAAFVGADEVGAAPVGVAFPFVDVLQVVLELPVAFFGPRHRVLHGHSTHAVEGSGVEALIVNEEHPREQMRAAAEEARDAA